MLNYNFGCVYRPKSSKGPLLNIWIITFFFKKEGQNLIEVMGKTETMQNVSPNNFLLTVRGHCHKLCTYFMKYSKYVKLSEEILLILLKFFWLSLNPHKYFS